MKRIISISVLSLLISVGVLAQMTVTPSGLKSTENQENTFIVIPFDGINAHDLYIKSVKYVNENIKDADASIKGNTPDEYLRFSTYAPGFIKYNNGLLAIFPVDAKYDIELRFKDGKVRLEIVDLKMDAGKYNFKFSGNTLTSYVIYKTNGDLFKKEAKEDVENYFNAVISSYIGFMKGSEKKNDW